MTLHSRILEAACRICRERGTWTFRMNEVLAALPDLNPGSVRTHVMSRCCVNAPAHHPHRWPYFRRVRRGLYEVVPAWRKRVPRKPAAAAVKREPRDATSVGLVVEVRESGAGYLAEIRGHREKFSGTSLDEVAARVRNAVRREGATAPDASGSIRMRIDLVRESADPVIAAYEKHIDRTLVRRRLRMGFEERLVTLDNWMKAMSGLRGAALRVRGRGTK